MKYFEWTTVNYKLSSYVVRQLKIKQILNFLYKIFLHKIYIYVYVFITRRTSYCLKSSNNFETL